MSDALPPPHRTAAELRRVERDVRRRRRHIERFACQFVVGHRWNRAVRKTRHFQEWYRCPMNYARIMEIPLTMSLLQARAGEAVLDVSSPKLLALYLAARERVSIVAADIEDYFVNDIEVCSRELGAAIQTRVFDAAQEIPFADGSFDKAFSVSVLEHIPGDGDARALREMIRVVRPGGRVVITLPAFPYYVEEWISGPTFYWKSVTNENGAAFFQRRYDMPGIRERFAALDAACEDVIFIAERPIREPVLDERGRMRHNSYLLDELRAVRWLTTLGVMKVRSSPIPLMRYLAERYASWRCHYLTVDPGDVNVRQVALRFVRR